MQFCRFECVHQPGSPRPFKGPFGLVLALLPAAVGLGWATTGPVVAQLSQGDAAEHLPAETALALLIDTTEPTWAELERYQFTQILARTWDVTPSPGGLPYLPYGPDFDTSIRSWVGDTAIVALLPANDPATATIETHSVMVAPIADGDAFTDYWAVLLDTQPDDPTIETYRDQAIYVWPQAHTPFLLNQASPPTLSLGTPLSLPLGQLALAPPEQADPVPQPSVPGQSVPPSSLDADPVPFPEAPPADLEVPVPLPEFAPAAMAVVVLPDAVVAANTVEALQHFLDLHQQGDTLADYPRFQRTRRRPQAESALVALYGNVLELLNFSQNVEFPLADVPLPVPPPPPPSPDLIADLQTADFGGTLEALIYPQAAGLRFQSRFYYDDLPFVPPVPPTPADADYLMELLPGATYALASGRNLAATWAVVSEALDTASDFTRDGLNQVRQAVDDATGLDLDTDILALLDGEFALAAFAAEDTPFQLISPDFKVGVGLLLQVSDRAAADESLAAADRWVSSFGLTANPRQVNGAPVTSWEVPGFETSGPSLASHGWLNADTLALVSGTGPMARLLNPSPYTPLAEFGSFQRATQSLAQPNNGYGYMHVGSMLALAYQVLGQPPASDGELATVLELAGAVYTLSFTSAQTETYLEFDALAGLAPHRPQPQ